MEMKGLIIGIGAAGNKSVINLIEKDVVSSDDVMLINSTLMDIPAKYKEMAYILEGTDGGFGKERTASKEAMIKKLKSGTLPIKEKAAQGYKFVAIVSSTEGGTGSGASTILAQYIQSVVSLPVHLIGFAGFGSDGRGLQNTMEFLQDTKKEMTVSIIRNDRFLAENNGSKIKAEIAANEQLAIAIKVIEGQLIKESTQNIDPRDIYKTTNTSGYQIVEYLELPDKIRNKKDFENYLVQMCDDSHYMQTAPSMSRLAVILNLNENSQLYADDFTVLKERYGVCYEEYVHRQSEPGKEFIAFICSGMKMPIDEAKEIYQKYQEASQAVDKSEDNFFDEIKTMKGNSTDGLFNMKTPEVNSGSEDDFFSQFEDSAGADSDTEKPSAQTPVSEY